MNRKFSLFLIIVFIVGALTGFTQNYSWNNPSSNLPNGISHHTYRSEVLNTDVGYSIYLPPNYSNSEEEYPVIYSLHGMGGNENSNCGLFGGILQDGINNNDFPPVIMVFVNGRGNTFYSDSKDGSLKCETSIITELIPHIDETYRTKSYRGQRAIEGISMGGFGALMLGFKYPDTFGSIGSYDAALVTWDTLSEQQFDQSIPNQIFGGDREYFNQNSYPPTLATKNADSIKALNIKVRMTTGDNDFQMGPLYNYNLSMRDTLNALGIELDFNVIPGGTHGAGMNQNSGKANILFHLENFTEEPLFVFNPNNAENKTSTFRQSYFYYTPGKFNLYSKKLNLKNQRIEIYHVSGKKIGIFNFADIKNGLKNRPLTEGFYIFNFL